MKKMIMALVSVMASACATTASSGGTSEYELLKKEIIALQQENEQLRGNAPAAGEDDLDARASAVRARLQGRRAPEFVPPARRPAPGLPQHFAWLHQPPEGCTKGPLSVEVMNRTSYFLTIILDGRALQVRGADGSLPHIPPGTTAYLCLNETGEHSLAGIAYVSRYGVLKEGERFNADWQFPGSVPWGMPHHVVRITDGFLGTY